MRQANKRIPESQVEFPTVLGDEGEARPTRYPGKRSRRAVPRLGGLSRPPLDCQGRSRRDLSPDGMTIQFDNGTIWQRAPAAPPPPLRRRRR